MPAGRTALATGMLAAMLVFAAVTGSQARAASTTYVGGNASTFATGGGGWTTTSEYEGICLPPVNCPQLGGEFVASGGTGGNGDGYLRTTSSPTVLAALLATSSQTWRSPAFEYKGVGGKAAAALTFSMQVRSGIGSLLNLGAQVDHSVTAVNLSGGSNVALLDTRPVGNQQNWNAAPTQAVLANSLNVGSTYRIEIRTIIRGLAAVLPAGEVEYDDVRLVASDGTGGNNGGNNGGGNNGGNNGNNGNDGNNGASGNDGKGNAGPVRFRPVIKKATRRATVRRKSRSFRAVRVTCRRAPCQIRRVKVRYVIAGKVYHRGRTSFPKARFKASKSRFIRVKVPGKVFRKMPRGRKVGFVKVRVVATSKSGARSTRNIAIGIGKR